MNLYYTSQFKKDYKRIKKQNKDVNKLKAVIGLLFSGKNLDRKYKDHTLCGGWNGCRDCHIEPDWILIYKFKKDTLTLERTGSHSELFK